VAGWLKAADALLFPSLTEGSPNVVLEAIACGCPVVAADLPGCRELITSPMFGRTCPSGCVAAFAEALLAMPLRRDAPFSPPLDERRKFGHRHSLDQVGQLWRAVYDRVLEGSHNQSFISRL
jgi:glycosyltransferase involved in cell wall biosynthesis